MENRKIILGLSGGVDSAASALMLKEMGYTVHGVFLRGPGADEGPAARAAEELRISFLFSMSERGIESTFFIGLFFHGHVP